MCTPKEKMFPFLLQNCIYQMLWWRQKLGRTSWFKGEGNGTPLQYSCLENPMDWGAWSVLMPVRAWNFTAAPRKRKCFSSLVGSFSVWRAYESSGWMGSSLTDLIFISVLWAWWVYFCPHVTYVRTEAQRLNSIPGSEGQGLILAGNNFYFLWAS